MYLIAWAVCLMTFWHAVSASFWLACLARNWPSSHSHFSCTRYIVWPVSKTLIQSSKKFPYLRKTRFKKIFFSNSTYKMYNKWMCNTLQNWHLALEQLHLSRTSLKLYIIKKSTQSPELYILWARRTDRPGKIWDQNGPAWKHLRRQPCQKPYYQNAFGRHVFKTVPIKFFVFFEKLSTLNSGGKVFGANSSSTKLTLQV